MAGKLLKPVLFFLLAVMAIASDPDITSDFIVPENSKNIDGNFFTFTGMREILKDGKPSTFTVSKASITEFPALNGQSVSISVLEYPAGGLNAPHIHPRSAELLFMYEGSLEVGFVDTSNKLYTQKLQAADMFIFPKGLMHYQHNADAKLPAAAISVFSSQNAGTASIPTGVFNTSIDDGILAKAFKTDVATIQKLKAGLATKA